MNKQEELQQVVAHIMSFSRLPNLRGVMAECSGEKLWLSYYFDEPPTEEEQEEASDLSGEVLASQWFDWLNEDNVTLRSDHTLPASKFWAYGRSEDSLDSR